MVVKTGRWVGLCLAVLSVTACGAEKSFNPLSPTIAGPISGVAISKPNLLEPSQDARLKVDQQPVRLVIQNASTSGQRPLSYTFQISSDAEFSSFAFNQSGIAAGGDGLTRLQLPDALQAGRTYHWRARAEDGANVGPFSNVVQFTVLAPVVLNAPTLLSPIDNVLVPDLTPGFRLRHGTRSGPTGEIVYTVEVANDQAFTSRAALFIVEENIPETVIDQGYAFIENRQYYWRARARDTGESDITTAWSSTKTFRTPALPDPVDPVDPDDPVDPGTVGSCASSSGLAIAACIERKYPQYLVAGVSQDGRKRNMRFLRDRMIEAARCGGLDAGWNLKRGGPEISVDFLAVRSGGSVEGIDIAQDYDNTSERLNLHWIHGTFPSWTAYTISYSCR